jgi:hypothetical protein
VKRSKRKRGADHIYFSSIKGNDFYANSKYPGEKIRAHEGLNCLVV